jgi:hypothetical protein
MAADDDRQAAEVTKSRKKLDTMVTTVANVKKRYDAARTQVLAATTLLEEERAAAVLTEEACATAALIEPPLPTPPPVPTSRAAPSNDNYEVAVIANIHVQAAGVQNIHSLISITLDLSSSHYAWWHDNILLTLGCYFLSDHVLLDTTYIGVPIWDRMDNVVKPWIWGTISPDLQDVTRQRGHMARDTWLALENHFLSNREAHPLHIDATFRSFVQGDLSVNDYCRKMKGFANSLADLGVDVTDNVLVLNVLRGLNKNFEHLRTIFTHSTPFPSFQKVPDDLCLEGIQRLPAAAPTTLYTMQKHPSSSSYASGQEHPPG